jgi:hypothetical protein
LALDNDHSHQRIGKQWKQHGATVVDTRTDLAHHLVNVLALGGTLDHELVCLPLHVRAILRREHTRLGGDPLDIWGALAVGGDFVRLTAPAAARDLLGSPPRMRPLSIQAHGLWERIKWRHSS